MAHSNHHPQPVDGCFGCKVASIGYDRKHLTHTVRDEAGNDVREHRSGRVDVRINAKPAHAKVAFNQ